MIRTPARLNSSTSAVPDPVQLKSRSINPTTFMRPCHPEAMDVVVVEGRRAERRGEQVAMERKRCGQKGTRPSSPFCSALRAGTIPFWGRVTTRPRA